ncbi:hypothetical protein OB997_28110, partial [Bacillus cereus]|nr:hypothetical protein [Bacillus cereus]
SLSIGMSKLIGHIRRGRGDVHGMWLEFRLVQETVEERIRREIADAERRGNQDFKKRLVDANKFRTNIKPVEATFPDGTMKRYGSITECAKEIGVSSSGVAHAIRKQNGDLPSKNLKLKVIEK